jgi:hypothetical protein
VGEFSTWVGLYPQDWLASHYSLVTQIGSFKLYQLNK